MQALHQKSRMPVSTRTLAVVLNILGMSAVLPIVGRSLESWESSCSAWQFAWAASCIAQAAGSAEAASSRVEQPVSCTAVTS